jgi:threonine/homoserine/homoserine lactone efflux protein
MSDHAFEFALASLLFIAVPGPDQALITRNALLRGRAAGMRTMLGGASGLTMHVTAAAVGASALLAASSAAYTTLKLVGTVYLLYLAVRMLTARAQPVAAERAPAAERSFAQGLVCNVLNPKVALFFLTFLPQFLPDDGPALPTALALSAVFAALYLAWFSGLVALVEKVGGALRKPRVAAWVERFTGGLLVAFALRLSLQRS